MVPHVFANDIGAVERDYLDDNFAAIGLGSIVDVSKFPYYADTTGVVDSTAAINAALATGHSVFMPKGIYKKTGPYLPVGSQTLYGESRQAVVIVDTSAGDGIQIPAGVNYFYARDFAITSTNGANVGKAFNIGAVNPVYIQNVYTTGYGYGMQATGTHNLFVDELYAVNCLIDGIDLEACIDVYGGMIYSAGNTNGAGLAFSGACSGIYIQTVQVAVNKSNFITRFLQPANVAGIPGQWFIDQMINDTAVQDGINLVQSNQGSFENVFASNRGTGKNFLIGPQATSTQINGGRVYNCYGHGLEIQGINSTVSGGFIAEDAGVNAPGTYDGIRIQGASATGNLIDGIRAFSNGATSNYGLRVSGGAHDNTIGTIDVHGNVQAVGFLDDSGAGANNRMMTPITGVTGSIPNTNTVVMFALPPGPGTYMVSAWQQGAANGGIRALAVVQVGTGTCAATSLAAVGVITINTTGADLNVQLTNNVGGAVTAAWSYVRVS